MSRIQRSKQEYKIYLYLYLHLYKNVYRHSINKVFIFNNMIRCLNRKTNPYTHSRISLIIDWNQVIYLSRNWKSDPDVKCYILLLNKRSDVSTNCDTKNKNIYFHSLWAMYKLVCIDSIVFVSWKTRWYEKYNFHYSAWFQIQESRSKVMIQRFFFTKSLKFRRRRYLWIFKAISRWNSKNLTIEQISYFVLEFAIFKISKSW